ncbi:uncharacterized protein [Pagrus major]|uniref:uncharacterized protein n=1 Tax=Pagrus major TaxID=143350 RepID=UPI003CC8937F
MQLHVYLLLFIITTDKTLALSHHHCGGNVSLDREPAGHINLTSPGLLTDTNRLEPVNDHSDETLHVSVCAWMIDIPLGRTVLLKLESGSNISVRCFWNEEDRVLETGGTFLLSGCDGNKASLIWTGAGHSNAVQLSYYVQEDERNSSEGHTSPRSDRDLVRRSQTGTSFTSTAPVGQEVVRGTEGGKGRLFEGLEEWSSGPQSESSPSSQDRGLPHPTSPLQGLAATGKADMETLPLPEEEPNNRADTSGAAHLADGRTHPYFQHSTDTLFHTSQSANTETNSSNELLQTQMALKHATDKYTITQTSNISVASTSSVPPLTSSPPEPQSWTPWESGTILSPRGGTASGSPGEKHSWRSQRSTDGLKSDLTSPITSDPLSTDTEPTASSSSEGSSRTHSYTAVGTMEAASFHPNTSRTDSFASSASDVTSQTSAFESSDKSENTETLHTVHNSSTESRTKSVTHSPPPYTSSIVTQTSREAATQSTYTTDTLPSSSDITKADDWKLTASSSTPRVQNSTMTGSTADTKTYTLRPTHDLSPTSSQTPLPHTSSSASTHSPTPSSTLQTHTTLSGSSHFTYSSSALPSTSTASAALTTLIHQKTSSQTSTIKPSLTPHTEENHLSMPASTKVPATQTQSHDYITTTRASLLSLTTAKSDDGHGEVVKEDEFPSSTITHTPTAGPPPSTTPHPSQEKQTALTPTVLTFVPTWSPKTSQTPKFYIVPDQPAAIRVQSIELLLQIIVEESRSAFESDLEEDTAAWVEPYLQRAPGFSRLLGVWSSGHAVQSLVEFKTSGALQWLSMTGPTSLLERTGLAQAVREGRSFRSSKITNVTLGGLQGEVCDWLLQCPAGYNCVSRPGTSNYSCSSVCHFDYCHHHGICTHHPGQLPVCRCLVGEDFWYMGQRCDVKMTRARLVGACLAILLIVVTVIGVSAFVAVRRYRAILIQAKVDQTRSSYRRFNHFDELSGRFWLRSWAGSADSLDNPAFTRSDELLHLRALDRPCCYHDDTLSLASTCPSHGTRLNTIYPHSSQYGWRGSEMSVGDGVLDSGKASDLSVCSWPVEPIQWTPFPLLQQLASHRTPTVRMSRPRSYCEGMELVDMGKSWTA